MRWAASLKGLAGLACGLALLSVLVLMAPGARAAGPQLPDPNSAADRLTLQGSLAEMQGDVGVARALYRRVLEEGQAPTVAAEALFRLSLQASDDAGVELAAAWLMRNNPGGPEVQVWLDRLYSGGRLGELDLALQALPDTVSIHLRLQRLLDPPADGVRVDSLGRVRTLEARFRRLLRQDEAAWVRWGVRSKLLWEQLLLFAMRQDRLEDAELWLAACPMADEDPAAWLVRARIAALREDFPALHRAVEQGSALDSLEVFFPLMAGRLALDDREPLLALDAFRRARRLDPEDNSILSLIALAQEDAGLLDDAESSLRVLITAEPGDEEAWTRLAGLLQRRGRQDEALALYARARGELGTAASAHLLNNYAYALAQSGEGLNEALVMAQAAVAAEGDNAAYRDTLGWLHFLMGDLAEAGRQLELAHTLMAGQQDWELMMHLGILRQRQGRWDEALALWRQALEALPEGAAPESAGTLKNLISGVEGGAQRP